MTVTDWQSLVGGYLASGDAGKLELLNRYLHEDVIVHYAGARTEIGLDREKSVWETARSAMPGLRHEVQEVITSDATLAARIKVSGTLHGSFAGVSADGKAFEIDQAIFMHLRDGRVQEMWVVVDTGSFYRQVGAFPRLGTG